MRLPARFKESLYAAVDRLSGGRGWERVISGQRLRLPLRYSRWFAADYETANVTFVNSVVHPGMTAVDVGAHIGFYSVILARRVGSTGRVVAFEPTPSSRELLGRTLKLNLVDSIVSVEPLAVGEAVSEVDFYITDLPAHNSNRLHRTRRPNERSIKVGMTSVDDWARRHALERVDFLKVDAEGSELSVLKGMVRTLEEHRPILLLALHPDGIRAAGDSLSEIWNFLKAAGYRVISDGLEMSRQQFLEPPGLFDVQLIPEGDS